MELIRVDLKAAALECERKAFAGKIRLFSLYSLQISLTEWNIFTTETIKLHKIDARIAQIA